MRRSIGSTIKIISITLTLLLIAGWLVFLRPFTLGGPAGYIYVSGNSMNPKLHTGDLALTFRQQSYHQGDIVAYKVGSGVVIHRIVGGDENGYKTRGDNRTSIDMWRPTSSQIVGRMLFSVPGAANTLASLRNPLIFATAATVLALFAFVGSHHRHRHRVFRLAPSPRLAVIAVAALAVISAGYAVSATYTLVKAGEKTAKPMVPETDRVTFNYVIHTQPSSLYPAGIVSSEQTASPDSETIAYPRLAKALYLRFDYDHVVSDVEQATGETSATMTISASDGWKKEVPVLASQPFSGHSASSFLTLNFKDIFSMIQTIEAETGYRATVYDITIEPRFVVNGLKEGLNFTHEYKPVFKMTYDGLRIRVSNNLKQTQVIAGPTAKKPTSPEVRVAGAALPIGKTWASVVGAVMLFLAAAALAGYSHIKLGRGEAMWIRARYGSMLARIEPGTISKREHQVRLINFADLAKIAQRENQVILYEEMSAHQQRYYVKTAQATYTYSLQHAPAIPSMDETDYAAMPGPVAPLASAGDGGYPDGRYPDNGYPGSGDPDGGYRADVSFDGGYPDDSHPGQGLTNSGFYLQNPWDSGTPPEGPSSDDRSRWDFSWS